ncbi:MAG: Histidine kinase, gyrase and HSP90-like ATPase [Anaerocolumna sp.]|jgi:anti-sigma regulatory factor (Ser/Thr protein kinase)|nr:Histidine kinase, gyrase and HSP90-like ATPase [Anaerocolumna sp.]
MMTELSLNVLDVAENSLRAKADFIQILLEINSIQDTLTIIITDNGVGMSEQQVVQAQDPFYTTRTTRNVGLGIPFFKYAAESTGGRFSIHSSPGKGTKVQAEFKLSHIDRMPLGDMTSTIYTLITFNIHVDFLYTYIVDDKSFSLDTREFRKILGNIPFHEPEVASFIKEYLEVNKMEVDHGKTY